jgi:hypothetical protein
MKIIFFYIIIFLSLIIPSFACDSCNNLIIYNETERGLFPYLAMTFKNETVIRLVKLLDTSPDSDLCIDPKIRLRWVRQDGTVERGIVDFYIPEHNFCPGPDGFYPYEVYRLLPDSIITIYTNSTDISSASFYGLITDRTGKFIRFVIMDI